MTEINMEGNPRVIAMSIANHVASLEDRVSFAEAIIPICTRYVGNPRILGYVAGMLPQGISAPQWIALAEDHLAFLIPEPEPMPSEGIAPIGGIAGVRADLSYWSKASVPGAP